VNSAGPFCIRWPHVDENFLAALHGISAKVLAARLDANHSLVFFRRPYAQRRRRLSLAATFEGEFSDVTRSYAGKGVERYAW
jgi:hypothetical protein